MKFIVGTKAYMTQVFSEDGRAHAATVLRVGEAKVIQVKSVEKDGYVAAQIATGVQKESRLNKAERGHLKGAYRFVKEYRPNLRRKESLDGIEAGKTFDASVFAPGDYVEVSAISKGKGFQGVVKRHGFKGASKSHGTKHALREPGSIGGGGRAGGRVIKGMRMAGRMGTDRITVKNLRILEVNPTLNLLVVRGAVPGRRGAMVEIRGM